MAKKQAVTAPIPISQPKRRPGRNFELQIGLIKFPVKVHTGARTDRVHFRQLHDKCLGTLKQQAMYCPTCDVDVSKDEIIKGFEFRKNEFVALTPEEIEAQKPETEATITIESFVPASSVDPIYFETSNYIAPGDGGVRQFILFRDELRKSGKVGIGLKGAELVLIRAYGDGIALHTLFYKPELNTLSFPVDQIEVSPKERKLGAQLIENMTAPFQPEAYFDAYARNVTDLVQAKIAGKAPKIPVRKQVSKNDDFLAALEASVATKKKVA